MKLFEISEEIHSVLNIEEPEKRLTYLNELKLAFDKKVLNIGYLIKDLQSDSDTIEIEIKRLSERKKSLDTSIDWLKEYLNTHMVLNNQTEIKDALTTIRIRKNPTSCIVRDVMKLPESFRKLIPESWQADKVALIKHFKDTGEVFADCEFDTTKTHVEIK